jgi:hypothetical protein
MLPAADAPIADPLEGAAELAGEVPPRLAASVGSLDATRAIATTPEEAQAQLREVATYCRTYCPVVSACVEERCRLWRVEQQAVALLRGEGPLTDQIIAL